jgi:hypothetical protein
MNRIDDFRRKEYELTLKDQFFVLLGRLGNVTAAASEFGINRGRAIGGPGPPVLAVHKTHPGRESYDRSRPAGISGRDAAVRVGVHIHTARDRNLIL